MPATITKFGNVIFVDDGFQTVQYWSLSSVPNSFSFDSSTNIVKSRFFRYWGMDVPLSQLTIDGVIPANEAAFDAALTTLSTLETTGGGGGGGTVTSVGLVMPSIFSVSGSPVTGAGTFTVTAVAAQGDIIYASAANTFARLAKDTNATRYLSNTGVANAPVWAQVNLANGVTGNLPVGNLGSGTGATASTFWRGDGTWATPAGGGATIYSADGVIAADRTVDLNGKVLTFSQGGNIFLNLDPTVDAEEAVLSAYNITDDGNEAKVAAQTSNTEAVFRLRATFNGLKEAQVVGFVDVTTATLAYTADTHTFNVATLFAVSNGATNLIEIDPLGFITGISANDGTGSTGLTLNANETGGDVFYRLRADDGVNQVEINGDAVAQTITLTAANGLVINGTPAVTDDVAIVGLTNTYTLHFICGLYTGTTIT